MGILTMIFCFQNFSDQISLKIVFPIHSWSVLGLVFCVVNKMSLNCTSCYFFQDFCYDHMTSQTLQICFLFIRSFNFNWSACEWSEFFLQFKEFELYWGAVFFKMFTHFHVFWSQIGVVIVVTPKQEMERKASGFAAWNFFLQI